MGADYHAHGMEKNRHAVDTFCQGAFDDGLTKRRITVDEFFAEFVEAVAAPLASSLRGHENGHESTKETKTRKRTGLRNFSCLPASARSVAGELRRVSP